MDIQQQAEAFRSQQEFEEVPDEWNLLKGMRTKSFNMPVFTHMNDYCYPCIYEDNLCRFYLNQSLPYPELYPDNPDRAGMSFVHILAVPKERIYNASFLRPGDAQLIRHMIDEFKYIINNDNMLNGILVELTSRAIPLLDSVELRDSFVHSLNLVRRAEWDSLGFYFHKHPDHSVGHLHMHCLLLGPGLTTSVFESLKYKNTPASQVLTDLECSTPN